jgi:uncharacterized membrane protein YfhO
LGQNIFLSDGQLNHFFKELSLWDSSWGAGYYIAADASSYPFYPLRILFNALMPNWFGFDLFVISAYVLASFFTFGYIKTITNDNFASFLGGLAFGFGSFMVAHLGHTSMIHAAAWMPLLMWSAEKLKTFESKKWAVFYIISIVMMILAGHLQIFTYSMLLLFFYVMLTGTTGKLPYKKYLLINFILIILAICISMFQLYPTYELAQLGFRKALSFDEYNAYILSFYSLAFLFFPHLYGNYSFDLIHYFGEWNLTEIIIYVGIINLFIAFYVILKKLHTDRFVQFWFFIAVFSLFLALGDNLYWLSRLFFEIPIINKFRALARHAMEFNFAIAVLTSMGIVCLFKGKNNILLQRFYLIFLTLIGLTSLFLVWTFYPKLIEVANAKNIQLYPFVYNQAINWSIAIYISSIIIIWVVLNKKNIYTKIILAIFIIINLGYFSYFHDWRIFSYSNNILVLNDNLKEIKSKTSDNFERILELEGHANPLLNPMLSSLYNIDTIGWYGPLITKNYSETTGVTQGGWTEPKILNNKNLLNMLNVGYIFAKNDSLNIPYSFAVGGICGSELSNSQKIEFNEELNITKLKIISNLACSTHIKQGEKVANIIVYDKYGHKKVLDILAGIDTSEWAYECEDVQPSMQHNLANIHSSRKHKRNNFKDCNAHDYTIIKNVNLENVNKIEFYWNENIKNGAINIKKVYLKANNKKILISNLHKTSLNIDKIINGVTILENRSEFKKAWLTRKVTNINEDDILDKIKNKQDFNYLEEAFTSNGNKNSTTNYLNFDENYNIQFEYIEDGNIKMQVNSNSGGYLVLSESYYPGWKAYIDGVETKVYRTNNILNGVYIPQGGHIVEFSFLPNSFVYSLIFSIVSLLIFLFYLYTIPLSKELRGHNT